MAGGRVPIGTVLEVSTSRGLAYLQYMGRHPRYGDVVAVLEGLHPEPPDNLQGLATRKAYVTFYPARLAVKAGLARIVAAAELLPGEGVPVRLRRPGAISNEGQVLTWIVSESEGDVVRRELTEEERGLPLAELWNHEFLKLRLESEWRPEDDFEDRRAGARSTTAALKATHYLYFPRKAAAQTAAAEAQAAGFASTSEKSADQKNWLVLATHRLNAPEELQKAEATLAALAQAHGGEYDGHETQLRS